MPIQNRSLKIGVFAYSFPHYKTYQGLTRLVIGKQNICAVFAQDAIKLNLPESTIRIVPRNTTSIPTARETCSRFNIPYYNTVHNDDETANLIKAYDLDVGIILGARILKKAIFESFKIGVINLHPGILPENRGLDNIKWAIINRIQQGVTAHFITSKIDHGPIIKINHIDIRPDDSLMDLYINNMDTQLSMINPVIEEVSNPLNKFKSPESEGVYFKTMPPEIEATIVSSLTNLKLNYTN